MITGSASAGTNKHQTNQAGSIFNTTRRLNARQGKKKQTNLEQKALTFC